MNGTVGAIRGAGVADFKRRRWELELPLRWPARAASVSPSAPARQWWRSGLAQQGIEPRGGHLIGQVCAILAQKGDDLRKVERTGYVPLDQLLFDRAHISQRGQLGQFASAGRATCSRWWPYVPSDRRREGV